MLKDKAAANLKAGEALAALGLTDPAAGRYYYAMYQSAVHALTRKGLRPDQLSSGAVEWEHATVMNNVFLVRHRRSDRTLYSDLRDLRMDADYGENSIVASRLAVQVGAVREFVEEATS